LPEVRRLVFADEWTRAQDLINQNMLGNPVGQLAYQTVGNLRLAVPGMNEVTEYYRQLDLTTATTSTSFVAGGVRHRRETFVSAPDQVIVMRLSADVPGSVSFTAEFDSAQ